MAVFNRSSLGLVASVLLAFSPAQPTSALVQRTTSVSLADLNSVLPLRTKREGPLLVPKLRRRDGESDVTEDIFSCESSALEHLRGGAGMAKKMGGKNIGLVLIFLSLLYLPRAMSFCKARIDRRSNKIQGLGCGTSLPATNVAVLCGIGLVLANSRQFDRHGRSKFKMRLTGSIIIVLGMFLVFAHAEAASLSWYSKINAYIGLILEWWGFVSLFYNFTPRLVAQLPRELSKSVHKMLVKVGLAKPEQAFKVDQEARQRELDRLNRWAQANQDQP